MFRKISLALAIIEILVCTITLAQPSGGPYGPVDRSYPVPETSAAIYYVAPDGDVKTTGTSPDKPTTIEKAFRQVVSGDYIILRGGIYRAGNLVLNQGITMQPFNDEKPVLKGTYVAGDWRRLRENLWITSWDHLFDTVPAGWWQREREGMYTPMHKFNNDMVFIDGELLQSAGWEGEVDEGSFFINYKTGEVYIGTDPAGRLVEITAFDAAIERTTGSLHGRESDGKGPVIHGITFTQYAFRAIEIEGYDPEKVSAESEHGKDVVGTTIEHCEISYCSRVAAYLRGDSLTVRNCRISHTSTEGIFILSSSDVLLEKNIFTQNNIERITGYYPAAVKIFNQCYRVTCNDNLVIDHPYSNGIWYDVGNVDGVFTNNWLQNIGIRERSYSRQSLWPGENAFFFEISKGAVVAGNVFVDCEHGATILNSSDVELYNNTFVNSMVCIGRTSRSATGDHFGWHPASGPGINERDGHVLVNNLFTAKEGFHRPLVYVWQPADLCKRVPGPPLRQMDHNEYVLESKQKELPVMLYSPYEDSDCQASVHSLADIRGINPGYEEHGTLVVQPLNSLFKNTELGNFQLISPAPSAKGAYTGLE
jgi:parallel beta-helix repeat protein